MFYFVSVVLIHSISFFNTNCHVKRITLEIKISLSNPLSWNHFFFWWRNFTFFIQHTQSYRIKELRASSLAPWRNEERWHQHRKVLFFMLRSPTDTRDQIHNGSLLAALYQQSLTINPSSIYIYIYAFITLLRDHASSCKCNVSFHE